jgi:hypothetical protein
MVPVSVPVVPLFRVIVNGVGVDVARLTLALNVPLPMFAFVKVTGPLNVIVSDAPRLPVAFVTVIVVFVAAAAWAATHASEARARTASVLVKRLAILVVFRRVCIVPLRERVFKAAKEYTRKGISYKRSQPARNGS